MAMEVARVEFWIRRKPIALGDSGVVVWVRQMKWEGTRVAGQGIGEGRTKVRAGGPVSKRERAIGMDEGRDSGMYG
jgi:hypothetical protein